MKTAVGLVDLVVTGLDAVAQRFSVSVTFNVTIYCCTAMNLCVAVGSGGLEGVPVFTSFMPSPKSHAYLMIVSLNPSGEDDEASKVTVWFGYGLVGR